MMTPKRRISDIEINLLITRVDTILEKMETHMEQTSSIDKRLSTLEIDYTRYKGFFGGVVFVLSALWAFVTFTFDNLHSAVSRYFGSG